jgi:hypothetical protein
VKRVNLTTNYFSTLRAEVVKDRPRFLTLFSADTAFMSFRGADLRGRSAAATAPAALCEPVASVITYYVSMTPAGINPMDLTRLTNLAGTTRKGPPIPSAPISADRYRTLCTRIQGVILDDGSQPKPTPGPGIPVSSLKCYRLDADKDIVGDKVYVGGDKKPDGSLPSEICPGPDGRTGPSESGMKPSTFQKVLGIGFGLILGFIVCGVIIWVVWSFFFKNYQFVAIATSAAADTIRDVPATEAVAEAARQSWLGRLGAWISTLACRFTPTASPPITSQSDVSSHVP